MSEEEIEKEIEILKEYQKTRFYTAIMEYINKIETELKQEKEKNKELEKQINLNKKTVEIAQTQILEYSQGYKDGLNKETTATAIVAKEVEFNFIRQEIKHKYISKDKIRQKIEENKKLLDECDNGDIRKILHDEIRILKEMLEEK